MSFHFFFFLKVCFINIYSKHVWNYIANFLGIQFYLFFIIIFFSLYNVFIQRIIRKVIIIWRRMYQFINLSIWRLLFFNYFYLKCRPSHMLCSEFNLHFILFNLGSWMIEMISVKVQTNEPVCLSHSYLLFDSFNKSGHVGYVSFALSELCEKIG